jgi:RNA recognition motif-containing protein
MKIYVGNLSYEVTQEDLLTAFKAYGAVTSAEVITDKYTGRSKGFAFVEMPSVAEGQAAIAGLNGKTLRDRTVNVSAARERPAGGGGSFQSDRRGGGSSRGAQKRY